MSGKHTSHLSFAYINRHQLCNPKPTDICMAPHQPGFVAALKWRRRRNGGETVGTVETHDNVQQPFDSNS